MTQPKVIHVPVQDIKAGVDHPTWNGSAYDHTVIDLSHLSEYQGGHTIVVKLPGGSHVTVGVIDGGHGFGTMDIKYHGDDSTYIPMYGITKGKSNQKLECDFYSLGYDK